MGHSQEESDFQMSSSKTVHLHPYWLTGTHNLAIIEVDEGKAFVLNDRVQPICLPPLDYEIKDG